MTGNESLPWAVRLFNRSVLKQRKLKEILEMLGTTEGQRCLDIGSDNGVISFLLRKQGGQWHSADLDEESVESITALVGTNVAQIDGGRTIYPDEAFDQVVIVDFLEHIPNDQDFIFELHRILKPGGKLIVNVPHLKNSLLRKFRLFLGQTDEKHGHLRPGYSLAMLEKMLDGTFHIERQKTYSKLFSEFVDTIVVQAVYMAQGDGKDQSKKGAIVTGEDINKNKKLFRVYSLIYPFFWFFAQLDRLLFFNSGYMLILKAKKY